MEDQSVEIDKYFLVLPRWEMNEDDQDNTTSFGVTGWVTSSYLRDNGADICVPPEKKSGKADGTVSIIQDPDLEMEVLSIDGHDASTFVQFPDQGGRLGVPLPYLVLYMKNLSRFVSVSVDVTTSTGENMTIIASNKQSVVRIKNGLISSPLSLVDGWNVIVLDLAHLVRTASTIQHVNKSTATSLSSMSSSSSSSSSNDTTGKRGGNNSGNGTSDGSSKPSSTILTYKSCERIRIHASTCVSKVYFCSEIRQHSELPPQLQISLPMNEEEEAVASTGQSKTT